jgi:DNA-directed RNA polymerase subunit M/transcription elongation factor TFIIS
MYYIRIDAENTNKLIYYCRNCGNEDNLLTNENTTVSKTQLKKNEQSFSHIINKYTKLDPTLPRVNNILCPNSDCKTNRKHGKTGEHGKSSEDGKSSKESEKEEDEKIGGGKEREVLYIRYDDVNMKYVYLCSTCDTVWKTDDKN